MMAAESLTLGLRIYDWGKCEHVDSRGDLCGRGFPIQTRGQVVCGEHSWARRIELQRLRTAENRARQRARSLVSA